MDYRQSKNHAYDSDLDTSVKTDSALIQLDALDQRFEYIAKQLMDHRDLCHFDSTLKRPMSQIFDLGYVYSRDVLSRLVHLKGYSKFHHVLKSMNADFHFQALPSAGMVRPTPSFLLIVESSKNYGANCDDKNRHMYPGFSANDNAGSKDYPATSKVQAGTPIQFRFL